MGHKTLKSQIARLAGGVGLLVLCAAAASASEPIEAGRSAASKAGGDLGGIRPALAKVGVEFEIGYVGETLGVVSGGVKHGFVYDGQAELSLDADLATLVGWRGATLHVSGIGVHGRGPSEDLLGGNLMDVSNIEARPAVRLYTLWLEQSLLDGRLAVRLGQLAADDEFLLSDTAGHLSNGTFGWAVIASANMTQGGPAYPLPTPGVRLRVKPADNVTFLAAVFSGNPGGGGCIDDAQVCNRYGTTFSLSGGTLWLGELQYASRPGPGGLPGSYKLGGWRETGAFPNQFTGANDKHGNFGVYAIADQMIWRKPGTDDQGLSLFLRAGWAPEDRNVISWYVDGGLGWKGPFANRPDDTLALGIAYGSVSGDAAAADRAAEPPTPVRDYEAVIELLYLFQLRPWLTLQPNLQYVIHPGGTVADPDTGAGKIENAVVMGIRTAISF